MSSRTLDSLRRILERFPAAQMQMAFGYGSGVFQQANHAPLSKNMIDLFLVVDRPVGEWHARNVEINSDDYSFLKRLGPNRLATVQESFGAKVYFNSLVKISETEMIKYGVISSQAIINDLLDWTSLYAAGRLHKPVMYLKNSTNADLSLAIKVNLENALHTAFLLLPEKFSEMQLYSTIASLSYTGDIRMGFAESDNKVSNIVSANLARFEQLYMPSFKEPHIKQYVHFDRKSKTFEQDTSSNTLYHHLNYLPHNLISKIVKECNKDGSHRDREEVMHIVKEDFRLNQKVVDGLREIVRDSSWKTTAKGLLTAGPVKSVYYVGNKVLKKWRDSPTKRHEPI